MKIEWAPAKIPPRRRFQTFVAGIFSFVFFFLALTSYLITAALLIYGSLVVRGLTLIYLAYTYYDHSRRNSVLQGNGFKFFRNNFVCRAYRDYFPADLVKMAKLPANKNYILACFPHGVIGTCVCVNMGLDIGKWLQLFPGVRPKIGTLDQHFYTPILREFIRLWGLISVSKESLTYYLTRSNDAKHADNRDGYTSNAIAILVGGAQEALDTRPNQYILTLKGRKGFVKLAVKTGSAIVPSFSFGEVDIFNQVDNSPGTRLRHVQTIVKKITGVAPLLVLGRGFFNYTFGMLPHRRRIVQVVGEPIDVLQNDNPDPKYVDEVHAKVIAALEHIFEQHKAKFLTNPANAKLVVN